MKSIVLIGAFLSIIFASNRATDVCNGCDACYIDNPTIPNGPCFPYDPAGEVGPPSIEKCELEGGTDCSVVEYLYTCKWDGIWHLCMLGDGDDLWGPSGGCSDLSDESCERTYRATGECGFGCIIRVEPIPTKNDALDNSFEVDCPQSCGTCKSGGSSDGGLPIDSDGVCKHFCSTGGYCGNGVSYTTGDNCYGCTIQNATKADQPSETVEIEENSAGCPTATVTKVTYGGKYFYTNHDELAALFGFKNMYGETMEIVKEGWEGSQKSWKIIGWKKTYDDEAHGRRDPYGVAGDWKKGDKMMSKACYLKATTGATTTTKKPATLESVKGCGMSSLYKCYELVPPDGSSPTNMFEKIGNIEKAEDCQKFCNQIYKGTCQLFMYDRTTKNCKLFSSSPIDLWTDCEEVGYAREPNFDQCHVIFPADSPNACYNFREDYCRFEVNPLENLENIDSLSECQLACHYISSCTYFVYDGPSKVCKLNTKSSKKTCDIIHGTPEPDLTTCIRDGKIDWLSSSDPIE